MSSAAGSATNDRVRRKISVVTAALITKKLNVTPANICGRVRARKSGARTTLARDRRGGLDAGDDRCRSEQDEAADDHGRADAPVEAAGEHHEPDHRHG